MWRVCITAIVLASIGYLGIRELERRAAAQALVEELNAQRIAWDRAQSEARLKRLDDELQTTHCKERLWIESGWKWSGNDRWQNIDGSVSNGCSKTIEHVEIIARFRDSKGKVLDSASGHIFGPIRSHEKKSFHIMQRRDRTHKEVELEVAEVRIE